jgi:hypothetical protein
MIAQQKPTGLVLVGFLTLCFLSGLAQADLHHSASDSLNLIAKFESDPVGHGQASGGGELKLAEGVLRFPWATHHVSGSKPFLPDSNFLAMNSARLQNDDLVGNASLHLGSVDIRLQKLSTLNAKIVRNLTYDASQRIASGELGGSCRLNLTVSGEEDACEGGNLVAGTGDSMQEFMHDFLPKSQENAASSRISESDNLVGYGNYLNIDVHGISVQAINTIEGGNAVATSNIIIKPVQTIVSFPEVQERLE